MHGKTSIPLLFGLMSCALPEKFIPTERATAISPDGYAAADYDVTVDGTRLGDVAVWTSGAKLLDQRGDFRTALLVTFQVENTSDLPLRIEPVSVTVRAGDRFVDPAEGAVVYGSDTIAPGKKGWMVLRYLMPKGLDPQELDGFEIAWRARAGDLVYAQRTPFDEYEVPAYAYPYPYLNDPYYWPYVDRLYYPPLPPGVFQ